MLDDDLRQWWAQRPQDQRSQLVEAAAQFRMDAQTLSLLDATGCPLRPPDGQSRLEQGRRVLWPDLLRRFLLDATS